MGNTTEYSGVFMQCRWANDEGTYCVGVMASGTVIVGAAGRDTFIPSVEYRFSGYWEDHENHGKQFHFLTYVAQKPKTAASLIAYLSKIIFGKCGIGRAGLQKIIARVGPERTLPTLKADPETVVQLTGISPEQAKLCGDLVTQAEAFEDTAIELNQLLEGRGFGSNVIKSAIEDFGVCAADKIRRDPFTMLIRKYPSAGFLRCDQLYRDLGLPLHKLKRQTVCLWYQLQQADGSTWIGVKAAIKELKRLVGSDISPKKAIELGCRAKLVNQKVVKGEKWLAMKDDAINERLVFNYSTKLRDASANTHRKPREGGHFDSEFEVLTSDRGRGDGQDNATR